MLASNQSVAFAACATAAVLFSLCLPGHTVMAADQAPDHAAAERGRATITTYGCAKCHNIPGIRGANGVVGPPLQEVGERTYIAGNFPNNPDTLTRWIMAPQTMKPKTAMPSLGLTESQARDVAAYLGTLR